MTIRIVELDYYRDAANPDIQLQLQGPIESSFPSRLAWIPDTTFVPRGPTD